jgi:endonuclease G
MRDCHAAISIALHSVHKRCPSLFLFVAAIALASCAATPHPAPIPTPVIAITPSPAAPVSPSAVPAVTELTSPHCLSICPSGFPANDEIVERHAYTLANNPTTKFADWVAYVVVAGLSGPDRSRNWHADPALPPADTLEEDDYEGAHAALGVDLGHQAPLASFARSPNWAETNFLSNITPQNSNLNRGRWARLERAERTLAARVHVSVYVLTGPLYEHAMAPLPHADEPHRVPSGYWKLIGLADGRTAAFIFENASGNESFCEDQRPISEIERRSGLHFANDNNAASLASALGCR